MYPQFAPLLGSGSADGAGEFATRAAAPAATRNWAPPNTY
jgi:hypothetical protein